MLHTPSALKDRELLLSVDPAQQVDYNALALLGLESISESGLPAVRIFGCTRNQKVTYDTQAERIVKIVERCLDAGARSCNVCIDAGGVGRGLLDMVRSASPLTSNAGGISLHGGSKSFIDHQFRITRVAKSSLISFIDGYFSGGRLVYSKEAKGIDILMSEIANLRADTTAAGNVTYQSGKGHDDIFFAVAQGLYYVASPETGPPIWNSSNITYFAQLATARAPAEHDYGSEVPALEEPADSLLPVRKTPYRFRLNSRGLR